jgi:hypothetical protein
MWITSKNGLPWSQEDLQQLRQMAASGMTATEIASSLCRTKIGVKSKALCLGISLLPGRRYPRVASSRMSADGGAPEDAR